MKPGPTTKGRTIRFSVSVTPADAATLATVPGNSNPDKLAYLIDVYRQRKGGKRK